MSAPMENLWLDELEELLKYPLALAHAAIIEGHFRLLQYLAATCNINLQCLGFIDSMNLGCRRDQTPTISLWPHEKVYGYAMDIAAKRGDLTMIKYLHHTGSKECSVYAMDIAAVCGNLNLVKWLHWNRNEGCTKRAMNYAAYHGHLNIVAFLHDNRAEGCTSFAMREAGRNGHLNVVKYLYENRTEGYAYGTMKAAAEADQVHVIAYLEEIGFDRPKWYR